MLVPNLVGFAGVSVGDFARGGVPEIASFAIGNVVKKHKNKTTKK